MPTTLLKTKFYRPLVRPELVPRPQLFARLDEGSSRKLTVVSAPAGYGKTSLVSAWSSQNAGPVAWLSLDEEDNDPVRFLCYLIGAVQGVHPNLGQDILGILQSPQPPAILPLLPRWINQLDEVQGSLVLVLDDYHLITSAIVHKAIAFILDHQPPQMHLILTTRTDPPLSLAQLRGRGQLVELRQADLRFSEEETAAFLKRGFGLELSKENIRVLADRTEGWIAGLQMASLSMQTKKDPTSFIAGFGGSHTYLVDYFASEILDRLPELTKSFLLETSFLDRLCGPLCDAVTGGKGGQQMLEQFQEANLFLVALDDERVWFRYHQLFADLLKKNMKQSRQVDVSELRLRASRWFEHNGYPHQAVEQAHLAGDTSRVAWLLEDIAEPVLEQGENVWLLSWLERLPAEQMQAHPRLRILRVAVLASIGLVQSADKALQKIETQFGFPTGQPSTNDYALSRVTALRAILAIQRRDVLTASQNARIALEILPKGAMHDASWRAYSWFALGIASFARGDPDQARGELDRALEEAEMASGPFTVLDVITDVVATLWVQGFLKNATEVCQQGLRFIEKHNLQAAPMSAEVFLAWSLLCCERCDFGQAEEYLARGTELAQIGNVAWVLAWTAYVKIRFLLASGNYEQAVAAVAETDQLPQVSELPIWIAGSLSAVKALAWVRLGQLDSAEAHLKNQGIWIETPIRFSDERGFLALAALLIAKRDYSGADYLLCNLIAWAEAGKQYRTSICAWALRASLYAAQDENNKALHSLAQAMDLAEPEGYMLTMLELGEGIVPVLYEAHQKGVRPELAGRLLACLEMAYPHPSPQTELPKAQTRLLPPLKAREVEVLRMAADGLSNKEIACKLHVSVRTVKFYMTSIFTRLQVDNRLQAVAKAKSLELIR